MGASSASAPGGSTQPATETSQMALNKSRARTQSTFAQRYDRAEALLARIRLLRKPHTYDNLPAMTDALRIIQTLLNTQNIEAREQELSGGAGNANGGQAGANSEASKPHDNSEAGLLTQDRIREQASKKSLTQEQTEQNRTELEEHRIILKRRKRMPHIEEYNLDDALTEAQKRQLFDLKRRRTSGGPLSEFSKVSDSTDEGDGLGPLLSAAKSTDLQQIKEDLKSSLVSQSLSKQTMLLQAQNANVYQGFLGTDNEEVSTQLASLKEMCNFIMVNYLTCEQSQQQSVDHFMTQMDHSVREFFSQVVAEKHSHLLIEACDHWISQVYFRVPQEGDRSLGASLYLHNLRFIFSFIESHTSLFLSDVYQFKKWLEFLRFLPKKQDELSQSHISKIMVLRNFKKDILYECIQLFVQQQVIGRSQGAVAGGKSSSGEVAKQDSSDNKLFNFRIISKQLMDFGSHESDMQDIHMFDTLRRLFFEEPWDASSPKPLFFFLPPVMQSQLNEGILDNFKMHLKTGPGYQINFTLMLFNELYKLRDELKIESTTNIHEYLDQYALTKDASIKKQLVQNVPCMLPTFSNILRLLQRAQHK